MDRLLAVALTPHTKQLFHLDGCSTFSLDPSSNTNARGFHGVTGTSQGDTPSPTNWSAAFDILLRDLEGSDPTLFFVRYGHSLHPVQDTAFADDLFYISARREGLQIKADIVSAFAAIFGIKIATTKLRTFAKCWGTDPSGWTHGDYHLIVQDADCSHTDVPKNAPSFTKRALRHIRHERPPSPLPSFPVLLPSPQFLS